MAKYTKDILSEQAQLHDWSIGEFTYGVPAIHRFGNDGKLIIGKYCSIASGVRIFLGGNHRTDWVTTYPFNVLDKTARHIKGHPATRGDVVIGNDVWLGASCMIMTGVTIGDGACVAAGALVAKDVPPYSLVGGNPARVLKQRFTPQQITSLLILRWWDWPCEKIRPFYPFLLSNNIDAFLAAAWAVQEQEPSAAEEPLRDGLLAEDVAASPGHPLE